MAHCEYGLAEVIVSIWYQVLILQYTITTVKLLHWKCCIASIFHEANFHKTAYPVYLQCNTLKILEPVPTSYEFVSFISKGKNRHEIQPGLEPEHSEFWSTQMLLPSELLHWSRGYR